MVRLSTVAPRPGWSLPEEVRTDRLRLPLITPAVAAAMRAAERSPHWHPDFPREDDLDGLGSVSADIEDPSWGSRLVVRALDGLVVGSIGFYGPPEAGGDGVNEAETGYGLVADARGRGVATEMVRGLLVHTDVAGVRVRARTEPTNTASLRVLAKAGFTTLRGGDEDGNLVMARALPALPTP